QNGLRLSGQPAELAGILTGVLLIGTILLDRLSVRIRAAHQGLRPEVGLTNRQSAIGNRQFFKEEFKVRNSQIAILSAVILVAALIVAGSNWWSTRSLRDELKGSGSAAKTTNGRKPIIAMMPKAKGDPYFVSCK